MNSSAPWEDPAFPAMALDVLTAALHYAHTPANMGQHLAEQVRELTGARCVLLVRCQSTATGVAHRVFAVTPPRRRNWCESPATHELYEIAHHLSAAQVWHAAEHAEAGELLRSAGFALSLITPLRVGTVNVGELLVLGLPDDTHLASELDLLGPLSTLVALVLRNTFLYESQELLIEERTRELQASNALLLQNDEQIRTLLAESEAARSALLSILEDERRSEEELRHANRSLRILSECNQAMIRATDEAGLLSTICRIVVANGGYQSAWVAYPEEDETKSVRAVAQAGFEADALESLEITWADSERGQGPASRAIRTGQPSLARDSEHDPVWASLRQRGLKEGPACSLGLPVIADGKPLGALGIYSATPDAFDAQEMVLLREMAADLAYGIATLRTRGAQARAERAARESAEQIRSFLKGSPMPCFVIDADHRLVHWNNALAEISGLREEQMVGTQLQWKAFYAEERPCLADLLVDQDRAAIARWYAGKGEPSRLGEDGYAAADFFPSLGRDGKWLSFTAAAIRDSSGTLIGALETIQDVTERNRAEAALRRELDVNRAMSELSHALISGASSLQNVADSTLHYARALTGSAQGFVSFIDPRTGDNVAYTLTLMMEEECQLTGEDRWIAFPAGPDGRYPMLWGHALNTRQAFYTNAPATHAASGGTPVGHIPLRNFLAVPALVKDKLIGEVALANADRDYTDEDLNVVSRLTSLYAMAAERAETESMLRDSEERWRSLLQTVEVGVVIHDPETRVVASNAAARAVLGLTEQQMLGKAAIDPAWRFVKEDGAPMTLDLHPVNQVVAAGRAVRSLVLGVLRPDRTETTWALVNADPVHDADGTLREVIVAFMDVTERKRAEARIALRDFALSKVHEAAFLIDENARLRHVNEEACRVLGYSRDELLGLRVTDIDPNLPAERWPNHWRELKERRSLTFEGRHRTKDGGLFPVEVNANYFDYDGQGYNLALVRDITERKRTEGINMARLRLLQFAVTHTLDELLQATLDEAEALTGSLIGFYHFLEADQKTLSLQNWSTRTKAEFCTAAGKGLHYDVSAAGVWVDCIHQRRAVIHNDYAAIPHRKGLPPGHAPVIRELVVPVFRGENIVAILGVGNKPRDYTQQDVETVSLLADLGWEIAERKRAEEVLRISEGRYRMAQAVSHVGNWEYNVQSDQFWGSEEARRIYGFELEQTSLSMDEVERCIPERERVHQTLVDLITAGKAYHLEFEVFPENSAEPKIIESIAELQRDERGNPTTVVGVVQDITERKRAEETNRRLALIVESSEDAIISKTFDGVILTWNAGAERLYGYSAEEIVGRSVSILVPPERSEELPQILARIGRGERIAHYETTRGTKDGRRLQVSLTVSALTDGQGKVIGASTIARDITEQKRAEEELQRYKNHLEELVQQRTFELGVAKTAAETANRAKSVFLANMSHELRTPLNAVLGFSSLLRSASGVSEEHRKTLDIINRSGEHLLKVINDVLDVAKIEAGRIVLDSESFDLGDMLRGVIDMTRVRAEEKGLSLLFDQSSQTPRFIRADAAKLRQVLINLIGNAIKYTQRGSVTMRLGSRMPAQDFQSLSSGLPPESAEGRNASATPAATTPHRVLLQFEVEDTGIGIAPEDRLRVFEPFVQLGKPAEQKGTGLGLTISRQYVELMGGTIDVQSTLGQGTRFRVELPVERTEGAEALAATIDRGRVVRLAPRQPEYRILIVEDEPDNWLLLRQLLEPVGFRVRVAENGLDGVAAFKEWRPHFIWMDRRMPLMDGTEATRCIRELEGGQEVIIVGLTASVFREQRNDILAAGMNDCVCKPYRPQEIFDCLARHLGIHYLYEGALSEEPTPALRPEALAALPKELREELADALLCLDVPQVASLVRRVCEGDAALGKVLGYYADQLAFTTIRKAMETGDTAARENDP